MTEAKKMGAMQQMYIYRNVARWCANRAAQVEERNSKKRVIPVDEAKALVRYRKNEETCRDIADMLAEHLS